MELELIKFIRNNENWRELLSEKPFSISIKEDENYVLFSYSQIDSNFSLQLVKECRGIILRKSDYKVVCFPFTKFFNVQETNAAQIDWRTARVQEKVDGSIIKVWFDNQRWHISTNGTIDARNAALSENSLIMDGCTYENYMELFISVFPQKLFYDTLEINKTYMFELVSPYNRIVVPYDETKVYHIGTRNNDTYEECIDYIGVDKPKEYNLRSLDDCLNAVQNLPFSEEGYVVVDNFWNRVKIKSPAYVAAHHLKNNGVITYNRIIDMIRANGQDDFIAVYPEYTEVILNVQNAIRNFIYIVEKEWKYIESKNFSNKKDLSILANKSNCPSAIYSMYDKKVSTISEWLFKQNNDRLLEWIDTKIWNETDWSEK